MNDVLLRIDGSGPLPDRVYTRVMEAILRGDFAPSGKLPTEGELSLQFGVSRPTVREALSRLRSDGVIDSKRGAGSFVIRTPGAPVAASPPIKSFADIERYYAYRSWVEAGAAAGAAEFRDAADLATLEQAFEALGRAMESGAAGVDEDVRFHLALAQASHNPFFVASLQTSIAPIRQFMELARNVADKKSRERVQATQAEHREIVDAIARRAPEDAAQAVRVHVQNAKRRIFESTPLP